MVETPIHKSKRGWRKVYKEMEDIGSSYSVHYTSVYGEGLVQMWEQKVLFRINPPVSLAIKPM